MKLLCAAPHESGSGPSRTSRRVCFCAAAGDKRTSSGRPVVPCQLSTAICSGLPTLGGPAMLARMGSKSRETIYSASVRAATERAAEARREADQLACETWNKRMLGFQRPVQPSPTLSDALNAGYRYLEVRCLGCDTHQTVASTLCGALHGRKQVSPILTSSQH